MQISSPCTLHYSPTQEESKPENSKLKANESVIVKPSVVQQIPPDNKKVKKDQTKAARKKKGPRLIGPSFPAPSVNSDQKDQKDIRDDEGKVNL